MERTGLGGLQFCVNVPFLLPSNLTECTIPPLFQCEGVEYNNRFLTGMPNNARPCTPRLNSLPELTFLVTCRRKSSRLRHAALLPSLAIIQCPVSSVPMFMNLLALTLRPSAAPV